MPKRIQRKRTKGWQMPENTISVCRPGKYGNPHKVGEPHPEHGWPMSAKEAVDQYKVDILICELYKDRDKAPDQCSRVPAIAEIKDDLSGHDLACWCPLVSAYCHADVLLEIANM